ncbi:3-oxoacyl-[acyl-carrier-protein] synthase-1 [Chryseobacterium bernardetii]|jgi:3-oxoacyl-[acyl-carrier-protein] synthase-1|uniref:3-oxoacyl-[acyl-carrier-protein] synthase-1 n=3 Tax=Chryseobacterium TaxID=59732 RepID=A0A543E4B5_9FLAO|nr:MULTISPECIES: beta-ketoacyl-[acyl-carrier-protein] synthase family protein [Chryseobacterium]MDR6372727.1 3-oxoacyl-[acyl-carrier-protein] synthase-1 [Chryseobacterium vietnamense]MDR6442945.1 3-oxoacyl-[acyl-carrier-protein] synthase-1 [Chryseobacterium bernardetii]MDR6460908.1 3-oxoacyl-[acyl-carrier-protein] synthase-1 [Chryseobacterium vietnamense]TQM16437.1 3-oxoacyl-[acyl-carrier-protein] synthase-1 [Chryseobacterium aquifrigidense]
MSQKIAITGMGIISSIGNNVEENFISLRSGKHGISDIEMFETRHTGAIKTGEIKLSNEELAEKLQLDEDNNVTRTSLLGMIAAKEAVESAGISDINGYRTGLISSTSVGGMDITEKYFYSYEDFPEKQKYIDAHDAGNSSLAIAGYLGLKGMVSTISTACSSAANAIMMGAKLIKNGVLDRVIVGGTDSLSKFTLNGFNTLMILTDSYNTPFDNNRKGLNLGEAAAFLVLESEEMVKKENKKVLAYLSGYGNANDAHHQTASSDNGQGAFLAMQQALKISGLEKENIDYINVHGTATPNNDLSEGIAMIRIFGENKVPEFSSTKAFTGHTLAAAAGIEAVFSVLAMQNSVIFPNLNFKTKMEEFDLTPVTELKEKNINHVLSNSFGFGGNCSTLIFSKS